MAERSLIEWTDATVNFWWGCTKVGPGCDHCYAETWARRTGLAWGLDSPRRKIKGAVTLLNKLHNGASWWAADHYIGKMHATGRRRVFIQSMSDLFDTEVPLPWFAEAWQRITVCDALSIQIVTKRISVVEKRLAAIGGQWPSHAGLMISIVNQNEATRDIPRLIALKDRLGIPWIGLSMEPLLGPVDLRALDIHGEAEMDALVAGSWEAEIDGWRDSSDTWEADFKDFHGKSHDGLSGPMHPVIDWVIVGGESGAGARPMNPSWVRSLRDQCADAGVPFFFKQWGEHVPCITDDYGEGVGCIADGADSPAFDSPRKRPIVSAHGREYWQLGKKLAGRSLDGVLHDAVLS